MTRVPGDDIPFFNTLPAKAIEPAAKLWDACRAPDFNRMTAYADFVGALNDRRVPLPARSLFNRWVAAVQINMVPRPGTDTVAPPPNPALLAYFENVPPDAVFALQAAWDRMETNLFGIQKNFEILCRDMNSVGHSAPDWKEFSAWVTATRNGEVKRPIRKGVFGTSETATAAAEQVAENSPHHMASAVKAKAERSLRKAKGEAPAEVRLEVAPATPEADSMGVVTNALMAEVVVQQNDVTAPALVAVKIAAGRLLEEMVIQLSAGIEHAARETAARMLREVADELEGGVVA